MNNLFCVNMSLFLLFKTNNFYFITAEIYQFVNKNYRAYYICYCDACIHVYVYFLYSHSRPCHGFSSWLFIFHVSTTIVSTFYFNHYCDYDRKTPLHIILLCTHKTFSKSVQIFSIVYFFLGSTFCEMLLLIYCKLP